MMTLDWIRERLADARGATGTSEPVLSDTVPVPAAVLVPIVNRPSGLTILLTQRTAHLRDHAGQVSFPGGRCEPGDATPVHTALRESAEEVGVVAGQVEVVGILPDYFTGTGFRVTPVVGIVTPPLNLKLDDFEVAEVFEAPLQFLLDPANYRRETVDYQGAQRAYWAVPWQGYFIWGATAGMLVSLRECLVSGGMRSVARQGV